MSEIRQFITNYESCGGNYADISEYAANPAYTQSVVSLLLTAPSYDEINAVAAAQDPAKYPKALSKSVFYVLEKLSDEEVVIGNGVQPVNLVELAYNFDLDAAEGLAAATPNPTKKQRIPITHLYSHAASYARSTKDWALNSASILGRSISSQCGWLR